MWLRSGWAWPFMGHCCLLSGFYGPVGLCTCADILTPWLPEKTACEQLCLTLPTFWTPKLFPSGRVRRTLPRGFGLHSSHIGRRRLGEHAAWPEMLTQQRGCWRPIKLPGMNLSRGPCFHIFLFLLWFKWAAPNAWLTLSGILLCVARANKNSGRLCSRFLQSLVGSSPFSCLECWILLLREPSCMKTGRNPLYGIASTFRLCFLCWYSSPIVSLLLVKYFSIVCFKM